MVASTTFVVSALIRQDDQMLLVEESEPTGAALVRDRR